MMSDNQVQPGLGTQYQNASNLNARVALHARFSTNPQGWHRWVFEQLDVPPRCQILELGCGAASLWNDNRTRIPAGWEITLSDFSPGMLQDARRTLGDLATRFRCVQIDAQAIPFADARFDAVIANHMLYHVPQRERAYAEIRRVLRPGGRLIASTIGESHLRELDQIVRRFGGQDPWNIAGNFSLESGADELARWFTAVTLQRYEDALCITEAGPLIAYIVSMGVQIAEPQMAELAAFVRAEIAARGHLRITKDSGMFKAVRV
jgi:SAM-dependent methyltransferase